MNQLKSKLRKVLLALVSLALSLILVEVVLRLSGQFRSTAVHTVSQREYESIPGMWAPSQDFISNEKPSLRHHVVTNALGLRGPETTLVPDKPRVLCIGDSFTYGDFVDNDESLPAQIQAQLGEQFEVLNGGVKGTTIVDQQVYLPRLLVLQPDVVLLTYCENDLSDLYTSPPMHEQLEQNRKLKSGRLGAFFRFARDTCLFNLVIKARSALRAPRAVDEDSTMPLRDPLAKLPEYVEKVDELQKLLNEREIDLLFLAFPSHRALLGKPGSTIQPVLAALREIGIDGIDPSPALLASGLSMQELYLIPNDPHPGPEAYRITASVVVDHLRRLLQTPTTNSGVVAPSGGHSSPN